MSQTLLLPIPLALACGMGGVRRYPQFISAPRKHRHEHRERRLSRRGWGYQDSPNRIPVVIMLGSQQDPCCDHVGIPVVIMLGSCWDPYCDHVGIPIVIMLRSRL